MEPAVYPMIRKNENSARSLGKEFTISFSRVIWPCAPQVKKISQNLADKFFSWGNSTCNFLFSKELINCF